MMIAPNQTPVLATLVEMRLEDPKCWLKIVLLEILEKDRMTGFLYQGRLLHAECHDLKVMDRVDVGQMIQADIEVTGNPLHQSFILHNVVPASDKEEE